MPKPRKTIDTWQLHVNYGQGWEHEVTEFTRSASREQVRAYRENCPYPVKLIRKRDPKANYTTSQLAEIDEQVKAERAARRARLLARLGSNP